MRACTLLLVSACVLALLPARVATAKDRLPEGFVYLREIAPEIRQDIRYFGDHNFLGRPVAGYEAPECILTREAAEAVDAVGAELARSGLGLKVYDCYRPQRAVDDFVAWSAKPLEEAAKAEFYPRVDKKDFFELGYVAKKSGHSRGSTVDLTITVLPAPAPADFKPGDPLVDCAAPWGERFRDGSVDMGTGYDCMDPRSHPLTRDVGPVAYHNRMMLRELMLAHGFAPYEEEWWHFTLRDEPFPKTFFDFPVSAP